MIVTNNEELAKKLRTLRSYGQTKKYYHDCVGVNSRLDEIQAAILRVKLKHLDRWNGRRRKVAELYNKLLADSGVVTPVEKEYAKHVYHLYVIKSKQRNMLQQHLSKNKIQTQIHYPIPVHKQKAYVNLDSDFYLPATEDLCNEILSLPMYPQLSDDEIFTITEVSRKCLY